MITIKWSAMLLLLLSAHLIAAQNWRYPDCRDLEITTIEMPTAGSNELFITVFNHCDTCAQHVYTGLMAFRGGDTLATEEWLFSKPSPDNKMDYRYKLLVDEPFEFAEDIRVEMVGEICDSIAYSPALISAIPSRSLSKLVQVYPNPTADFIKIIPAKDLMLDETRFVDINGRTLKEWTILPEEISLEQWTTGVYWLIITSNKGQLVKKVVLQ